MTEFLRTVMATKDVATSLGAVRGVKGVVTFSDTKRLRKGASSMRVGTGQCLSNVALSPWIVY